MTRPESQPRHPLALLVGERNPRLAPEEISVLSASTQLMLAGPLLADLKELVRSSEHVGYAGDDCDPEQISSQEVAIRAVAERLLHLESENAALRAQAEAAGSYRAALAHYAELCHYDHAGRLWSGDPDEHEDAQVDFGEIARAALAQAGGES